MKNSMKTMGQLSVILLICVLLGQGMWLNHVREIKMEEFRESANDALLNTTYKYLFDEGLNFGKNYRLTYSLIKNDSIGIMIIKRVSFRSNLQIW